MPGRHLRDVEDALLALLREQRLQRLPHALRALGGALQEGAVAFVRRVVALDELADVDAALPSARREAAPRNFPSLARQFRIARHNASLRVDPVATGLGRAPFWWNVSRARSPANPTLVGFAVDANGRLNRPQGLVITERANLRRHAVTRGSVAAAVSYATCRAWPSASSSRDRSASSRRPARRCPGRGPSRTRRRRGSR